MYALKVEKFDKSFINKYISKDNRKTTHPQ